MAKDIEPKLKLISDYLRIKKNEMFVIPEYQRAYSWTNTEQCDKLWQDIETFMESGDDDPYFFGTIIVDCSDNVDNGKFSLIDGQQRTTTFLLLLKALQFQLNRVLSLMPNDEESEALKEGIKENRNKTIDILCKTDGDTETRLNIIRDWSKVKGIVLLENKSINEQYSNDLQSILEAKDYNEAEKNCIKIPRRQKDNKYTNFFRNFKFFYYKLDEYQDSQLNSFAKTFLNKCQIIEIRSWQIEQAITMFNSLNSTGMPLSDADIISAQLYSNAAENKNDFNEKWSNIIKLTSDLNALKIASIDSVLQQYMYIFRAQKGEYMRTGTPDVTTPGLRKFYTIIHKELLKQPLELCDEFKKIAETWDFIKDYPTVKLLLKFNENAKIYLMSYLRRFEPQKIKKSDVDDIALCLIRLFVVLELVDFGFSSNKFKTFLFGENTKIVNANVSIDEIKEDFNRHITTNWNQDELKQSLIDYDKNILVFLNEFLYAQKNNIRFDFSESTNVEHIMPASGHNIDSIRLDANISTPDEFKNIVNKLGNKILLEEDINKSIGREWFMTKKQQSINSKAGYKDSKFGLALSLVNYDKDKWTKEDIEECTNKVADRIVKFIFYEE